MWGTNSAAGKHMDKTLDLIMLDHPRRHPGDVDRNRPASHVRARLAP